MTRPASAFWGTALAAFLLSGCGDQFFGEAAEPPLPGERLPVLSLDQTIRPDPRIADLRVVLPAPFENRNWPQAGGLPNHAMHHLAAPGRLERLWRVDIGAGSSDEGALLTQPVIAGGRVYTLDVAAELRAHDLNSGERLWRVPLEPEDSEGGLLGGGIAVNAGRVFVSTGFAETIALSAASGETRCRPRPR